MATTPGFLTDFPWKNLGSYKCLVLTPLAMQSAYIAATKAQNERDYTNLLIIPFLMVRAITGLIWTSVSRHRTAKGKNRIVNRSVEFEQVDKEHTWADNILLMGIVLFFGNNMIPQASFLPLWRTDGIIMAFLLHIGPLEYLYYWLHRALHHHYLYSRYHSHHHTFVATDPNTGLVHPFAENLAYIMLFGISSVVTILTGTASLVSLFGYLIVFDFMNCMGHCNFEFIPHRLFSFFPPLKYLIYTPSFHSLHHTQFRTNYSLFMPFYDWIHGTMDTKSDSLHLESLRRQEDSVDVVHLTHLTTPDSVFHLRLGMAYYASRPHNSRLWYMWPLSFCHMVLNFAFGRTFILETNSIHKLNLQSWVVPRYSVQYSLQSQRKRINGLIEQAILDADAKGVKVLSLGLLNQGDQLNQNGELYIGSNPKLNIKVVDGSSLVVPIVINSIPKGTTEVLLRGRLSKVSYGIVSALCNKGIKVATLYEHERHKLSMVSQKELVLSKSCAERVWIVGEDLTIDEQLRAPKGTLFIPFSQLMPKKVREHDCIYALTPSMEAPTSLKNLHSCENWLPRRVMSASRVAGIVHALEGLDKHECGSSMLDVNTIWEACLKHGFRPSTISN